MVLVRRALKYLELPQETIVKVMLESLRKILES